MRKIINQNRLEAAEQLIRLICISDDKSPDIFFKLHKQVAEKFGIGMLSNDELTKSYHILLKNGKVPKDKSVEEYIRLKRVRSLSGIIVVSVLTKPYKCPGKCLYCPTQEGLPKSYMNKEPAVMRAVLNNFDPYRQTQNRLSALSATGHNLEKINIRVIGGTWSYYPKQYQGWFIKRCFQACNEFSSSRKTFPIRLSRAQKDNETAKHRIVEISIETRQDYINILEIKRLRRLGVTKVELGVQSIYDDILKINQRGHDVATTVKATKLLKDAGFKVAYQVMLNLAGANIERDRQMLKELFSKSEFRPDYLKIYPLAIVREAEIYKMYKQGKLKPYTSEELISIIQEFKCIAPYYLRIERIIRDIPSDDIIEGGAKVSNLRQMIQEKMAREGKYCRCIRCREVASRFDEKVEYKVFREDYDSSDGREIFLSIESKDCRLVYSILRLRIPSSLNEVCFSVLNKAALVREIHTYGPQLGIAERKAGCVQHRGFGKQLMVKAEEIINQEFPDLNKIVVIAGVGTRDYFRKLGYKLNQTYMVKSLN
ncbi:MAG: tRNA uridine(34) 5-carboxymethylaminomethyl modification radical SAM/GNAT enzyme Elp3 [bacterium]|nr:tRNA uridine(34) 5-carboxymethylaminomethyl modification radical SAM/GNAT enzyme Elp3 [bacterium]